MTFDFEQFARTWKKKIVPWSGVIFAGFMIFMLAMAGLGPLMKQWSPDNEKIDAQATERAAIDIAAIAERDAKNQAVSLAKPHRSVAQTARWAELSLSEMMNFTAGNYDEHMRGSARFANETARSNFHDFVIKGNVLDTLKSNGLQLRASVEGEALLLNKGEVNGSYRWLYEVPVLLTFLPVSAKSYKNADHVSQHVIVTAQVGRVTPEENKDELMVESFSARVNPDFE